LALTIAEEANALRIMRAHDAYYLDLNHWGAAMPILNVRHVTSCNYKQLGAWDDITIRAITAADFV
jgi:hypothetical protein